MKVGDLVRVGPRSDAGAGADKLAVIVSFKSFERGKNPQPIVMIDGKLKLVGWHTCEVISEAR